MKLPGLPKLNLDVLEDQLTAMHQIAYELHGNFRTKMLSLGVTSEYLDRHYGDWHEGCELKSYLPDIDDQYVEYSGTLWRYGDTDYFEFKVDRAVLEDTKSLGTWCMEAFSAYASTVERENAQLAEAATAKAQAEKERRFALYEDLREEFDGASGVGTEGR